MTGVGVMCLRGRPAEQTAEDVDDMLAHGFDYHEILAGLGITHDGVLKALKKAGRQDLAEKMSEMRAEDIERLRGALGYRPGVAA